MKINLNQRIRVLINGQGCYCTIRDVCSPHVQAVVDEIVTARFAGRKTTGLLKRMSHTPQIDVQVDFVD